MDHKFGGAWTRQKIDVLKKYLSFYSTALKNKHFKLHYVDAFAGTGTHIPDDPNTTQESFLAIDAMKGSVITALEVEPGFDYYHFNDLNLSHVQELEKLRANYSAKEISISQMDANAFVPEFCKSLTDKDRAVLFIDPYSSELNWETLKVVARSGKIDVWLLFPLSVIIRMTPNEAARIKPEWHKTLVRLLGTDEWQQTLYKPVERPLIEDMFGTQAVDDELERVNWVELQNWVTARLKQEFPYVADPIVLKNKNRPLFSFYFLVSNPSPIAASLAAKVANHILRNER